MDPKLRDLVERTNLGDLLRHDAPEMDMNQPVATLSPPEIEPARSTSDPLQINFATADIAGRLQDSRTGSGLRTFALVFIGGPLILTGLGMVAMAWTRPTVNIAGSVAATLIGLGMAGFWPYVIFKKRRRDSN